MGEIMNHIPAHSDSPTWCERCGTFDIHFNSSECREVSKKMAFWIRKNQKPDDKSQRPKVGQMTIG